MSPLYVYALLSRAPEASLPPGLQGERLRLVECGPLAVAAGHVAAPPVLEAAALRAHDVVVRAIADLTDAVLPARFGSVLDDEAAVREFVRPRAEAFLEALELVRGCVQMTLRLYAGEGRTPGEATAAPVSVAAAGGPGARYLADRARKEPDPRSDPGVARILDAVAPLVRAEKVEPHAQPPLLASAFHLVRRADLQAYSDRVDATAAAGSVRVTRSGPWPAYAFAPEGVA